MKAKNENGLVVFYPTLPSTYRSDNLGLVLSGFGTLGNEVLESEGFFDVVTPVFDPFTQQLSPVYFDDANNVFTYSVLQLENPIQRPPVERKLTKLEFINRFTNDEFKGLIAASKLNADIELWMLKFNLSQYIDLNNQQTIDGLTSLEASGLIAAGRAEEILSS